MRYHIYDQQLESDLLLPELPVTDGETVDIRLAHDDQWTAGFFCCQSGHAICGQEGEVFLTVYHRGNEYLASFPGLLECRIGFDPVTIHYHELNDTNDETIRHLLIDQLIPRVLGQMGKLILHASAVRYEDDQVVLFIGDSGAGKSTLATACGDADLLADDGILVDITSNGLELYPAYQGLRLQSDSIEEVLGNHDFQLFPFSCNSDKWRVVFGSTRDHKRVKSSALSIFLLAEPGFSSDELVVEPVTKVKAVSLLSRQVFMLDNCDRKAITSQFQMLTTVLDNYPDVYRLAYPYDYKSLGTLKQAVRRTVTTNQLQWAQ